MRIVANTVGHVLNIDCSIELSVQTTLIIMLSTKTTMAYNNTCGTIENKCVCVWHIRKPNLLSFQTKVNHSEKKDIFRLLAMSEQLCKAVRICLVPLIGFL